MRHADFCSSRPVCASAIALALGTTLAALPAQALTLNSSVGTWGSVTGGSSINYTTVGLEQQVRWGDPATLNGQSGLGFTGIGALLLNPGSLFQVGTLRHFNQPIWSGTAASAVDLSISLNFLEAGLQTFDFSFDIDETPNSGTCAYFSVTPCADKVSWASALPAQSFVASGVEYTLELLGFSSTLGGPLVADFISQEGGNNTAYLYAKVTEVPSEDVPEPLGILGVLAAIGLGRRFLPVVKA